MGFFLPRELFALLFLFCFVWVLIFWVLKLARLKKKEDDFGDEL